MTRRLLLTAAAASELVATGLLLLVYAYGYLSAPYHGPATDPPLDWYVDLVSLLVAAAVLLLALTLGASPAPRGTLVAGVQLAGLVGLMGVNLLVLGWLVHAMATAGPTVGNPDSASSLMPLFFAALAIVALAATELPARLTRSSAKPV